MAIGCDGVELWVMVGVKFIVFVLTSECGIAGLRRCGFLVVLTSEKRKRWRG